VPLLRASRIALVLGFLIASRVCAQTTIQVATAAQLVSAITTVDSNPNTSYLIQFTASVTLSATTTLPAINTSSSVTIDGQSLYTLDGGGVQRGFLVYTGTVTIQNITIQNTLAQGGNGGSGAVGGGGGFGAGGALAMLSGTTVTLNNVTFGTSGNPNTASGGNGGSGGSGSSGNGGGGGFNGGNGGNGNSTGGGGGGGIGLGANGGAGGSAGSAGIISGTASAGSGGGGSAGSGGATAGGGGGGATGSGGGGGGGGIGGSTGTGSGGGGGGGSGGGGGGGGGSSSTGNGGTGGSGAGGGGGAVAGGAGGSIGGGGGGGGSAGGSGALGGGNGASGSSAGGGGGLGAGGAIYDSGGNLSVTGPLTISGNKVTAGSAGSGGSGATAGSAYASGILLSGNDANNGGAGLLTFAPASGKTQTISDVIGDQTGGGGVGTGLAGVWGLTMSGAGNLILSGANTFSGGVNVNNGILSVSNVSGSGTGSGPVTVANGATIAGTGTIASTLNLKAGSFFAPGSGIGTLSVSGSGGVTWNTGAEALYTLSSIPCQGTSATSSKLAVASGGLGKGLSGGVYLFNFQNTGAGGNTYTLATFPSTNFLATDFTTVGLPTGLTGTFAVSGTQLQFTTVATVAAPVITSATTASGTNGTSFSYSITATNSPTSYSGFGVLPPGVSLNTSTGVISGTPIGTGTFIVTIGASNVAGTGTSTLTIAIAAPPSTAVANPVNPGGGGAPSIWFYGALALLLAVRHSLRHRGGTCA
jgi:hypothetical protein